MAGAAQSEHVPNPVASDERAETLDERQARLTAHQADAEAAYQAAIRRGDSPPNFDAVLKAAGTTYMEWIQVKEANRLRAELARERDERDRAVAAAKVLVGPTEAHIKQQAGNIANRESRGQRAGKAGKRLDAAKALVNGGATYEAAALEVGYEAGGDALRQALRRAGFVGPRARKR
jgi:hypothetical protein